MKLEFKKILLLIFLLSVPLQASLTVSIHALNKTTPVASPEEIRDLGVYRSFYGHKIDPSRADVLHVVGLEEGTTVSLYDISAMKAGKGETARLVENVTVSKWEVHEWKAGAIPAYFKIVADKPILANLFPSFSGPPGVQTGICTFYPSTNGRFVGRGFIFEALRTHEQHPYNAIYAVQDALVEIYDASGHSLASLAMPKNTAMAYNFTEFQIYRVNSTGDIMIRTDGNDWALSPSTSGNFVGKTHFAKVAHTGPGWIWVMSFDPGTVKLYNMSTGELTMTHAFSKAGDLWLQDFPTPLNPDACNIRVESTMDTIVASGWRIGGQSIGGSTGDVGGLYSEYGAEYWLYLTEDGEAVIYAHSPTTFTINGESYTLNQDEYLEVVAPPIIHVESDNTLVITLEYGGVEGRGFYLVSPSDMPIVHPTVGVEVGGGIPIYLYGAVAVAVVVVIFIVYKKRPRR